MKSAVTYQVVLTKIDKLKPAELEQVCAEAEAAAEKSPAAFPGVHATSSERPPAWPTSAPRSPGSL